MKTLKSFDFGVQRTRSSQYDWDKILCGDIVVLEAGKDFDCKPETMKTRARTQARKMGLKAKTGIDEDGNVVVQSYEPSEEEKERDRAMTEKLKKARAAKAAESDDSEDEEEQETPKKRVRRRKAS